MSGKLPGETRRGVEVSNGEGFSPWRKDSVGMKKAAVHIPSSVMNFRNQKLNVQMEKDRRCLKGPIICKILFTDSNLCPGLDFTVVLGRSVFNLVL